MSLLSVPEVCKIAFDATVTHRSSDLLSESVVEVQNGLI